MARRHNGFSRIAGSTYTCLCCKRLTRNTGVQGLGTELCPPCFELAGIENSISDYGMDDAWTKSSIKDIPAHIALITKKGGSVSHWTHLMELAGIAPAAA